MERFLKIPHHVFLRLVRLSLREKCAAVLPVYLALLYHADKAGKCFPGYERIARLSGVKSYSTIALALRVLEKHGFLRVERQKGCANRYFLAASTSTLSVEHLYSDCRTPLHSLEYPSTVTVEELDPINYNHLTIPKELEKGERAVHGRAKKRHGMPESEEFDAEYYLS